MTVRCIVFIFTFYTITIYVQNNAIARGVFKGGARDAARPPINNVVIKKSAENVKFNVLCIKTNII